MSERADLPERVVLVEPSGTATQTTIHRAEPGDPETPACRVGKAASDPKGSAPQDVPPRASRCRFCSPEARLAASLPQPAGERWDAPALEDAPEEIVDDVEEQRRANAAAAARAIDRTGADPLGPLG
jgi:hypothetical protein